MGLIIRKKLDSRKVKKELDFFFKNINFIFNGDIGRNKLIKVFRFNRFLVILFFLQVLEGVGFFDLCLFGNFIFYFYSFVLTRRIKKKIINLILKNKKINFFFFFKFHYYLLDFNLSFYFFEKILNVREGCNTFFLFFWKNDLFFFFFLEERRKVDFNVNVYYDINFSIIYNFLFFNVFSLSFVSEYNLSKRLLTVLPVEPVLGCPLFVLLLNFNLDFVVLFNVYFYIGAICNVSFFFFEKFVEIFIIFSFFFSKKKFEYNSEFLYSSLGEFVKVDNLNLESYVSLFYLGSVSVEKKNNQSQLDNYFFLKNIFNMGVGYNSYSNLDNLLNDPLSHLWWFDF